MKVKFVKICQKIDKINFDTVKPIHLVPFLHRVLCVSCPFFQSFFDAIFSSVQDIEGFSNIL